MCFSSPEDHTGTISDVEPDKSGASQSVEESLHSSALSEEKITPELKSPTIAHEEESLISLNISSPSSVLDSDEEADRSQCETPKRLGVLTPSSSESKKPLTPKQLKRKSQLDKVREEKTRLKEQKKKEAHEQKMKALDEKKKIRQEKEDKKLKEKQEKLEQKQKEIEEKQKEKDLRRKEREEKEELKRKEQEEKNREKLKQEEKKQKAAAVFANFFTKKWDTSMEERPSDNNSILSNNFMPFEVKSDMKLAPIERKTLNEAQKSFLTLMMEKQMEGDYLSELKAGKGTGKSNKTWALSESDSDDVVIVEDANIGETLEEQPKPSIMRAKFLKFAENRRPAYFGTWRKRSKVVKARKPFVLDSEHFDYEIDSDEDWEEDDSGESLQGSDDEDKENDSENEYEVDNEFFVPHGHLSDDEINDEDDEVVSPEAHKAKLKLLKKEFEEEMKNKTQKLKSRVIGCIWHKKNGDGVDPAIHEFLKPFAIISNGQIEIKKRTELVLKTPSRKSAHGSKLLEPEFVPEFLKMIHGSVKKKTILVDEYMTHLENNNVTSKVSKTGLMKQLKLYASWTRSPEGGAALKKFRWCVHKEIAEKYKVELALPN